MNVLHLSTSDIESGAAKAAFRLHQGLQTTGLTSQMLVRAKVSSDSQVISEKSALTKLGPPLSGLPFKLTRTDCTGNFSLQWFPDTLENKIAYIKPDLVNLHWICNGFLRVETLRNIKQPLVWTLHDMWAFTGGCHYNKGCDKYTTSCGSCPKLSGRKQKDLAYWVWNRKRRAWKNLNLTIVAPSQWMSSCAKASALFRNLRVETIPNGIDIQKYRPISRSVARDLLGLRQDKNIVLFGAGTVTDPRKGLQLLRSALKKLSQSEWRNNLCLLTFGVSHQDFQADLGLQSHNLGKLNDDLALAIAYSAADIFVASSTQDNLPNTVMEALACGVPCVAFNIGGIPDMIEHQRNGYLAKPFEIEDLAKGMTWILEDKGRHQKLCVRSREKVEQEFSHERQARRYLSLYNELREQSERSNNEKESLFV